MKKFIEFIKESLDEEEIRNIFNDFLDEFGISGMEFRISENSPLVQQIVHPKVGKNKVKKITISIRIPSTIHFPKEKQYFLHTYLYFGIHASMLHRSKKEIEENVHPRYIEILEEIEDRMEEIGLKMCDTSIIGNFLKFTFKKN